MSCCLTAIFLLGLISVTALVAVPLSSAIFSLRSNEVEGQNSEVMQKQDIFKIIVTVNGLDHESGDVITLVTVNGLTKSKLFDDTKTYLSSSKHWKTYNYRIYFNISKHDRKNRQPIQSMCATCQELRVNLSYREEFSCIQTRDCRLVYRTRQVHKEICSNRSLVTRKIRLLDPYYLLILTFFSD